MLQFPAVDNYGIYSEMNRSTFLSDDVDFARSSNISRLRVCSGIITYHPDLKLLTETIQSLAQNVDAIFIFDNSEDLSKKAIILSPCPVPITIFSKDGNIGIAAAQNIVLTKALKERFDLLLMSDQDTIYPAGYVSALSPHCFGRDNIAAVVPGWVDVNLCGEAKYPGQYTFDSNNKLRIVLDESKIIEVSHAISSGMVINLRNLHHVGLMKEELFIDWVDNEWCWRARASGLVLLAVPSVKVRHTLGDCTVNVFGKNFVKRGVMRNFYIIRNAIYLVIHSPIPLSARTYLAKKAIHHTIFSLIVSDNKFFELRWLARAWLHGLQGKLGKVL